MIVCRRSVFVWGTSQRFSVVARRNDFTLQFYKSIALRQRALVSRIADGTIGKVRVCRCLFLRCSGGNITRVPLFGFGPVFDGFSYTLLRFYVDGTAEIFEYFSSRVDVVATKRRCGQASLLLSTVQYCWRGKYYGSAHGRSFLYPYLCWVYFSLKARSRGSSHSLSLVLQCLPSSFDIRRNERMATRELRKIPVECNSSYRSNSR